MGRSGYLRGYFQHQMGPGMAWLHGYRHQHLAQELKRHFIEADHGTQRIIRLLIEIQKVFHAHEILAVHDADAPLFLQPRLKFIFFNASATAV